MIPTAPAVASASWIKLPKNQGYELHWTNGLIGTLRHPTMFSSSFLATSSQGNWTFRRVGLLGASAEITDSFSQQRIATFKSAWGGSGALRFADGELFHVECKGIWHPVWMLTDESRHPLLWLHSKEGTVELAAGQTVSEPRLFQLAMFALYRLLTAEEDAASAAMIAVS